MRDIRQRRRMSTGQVARAMDMPVRSYEHLEQGTGRITYERVVGFAEATASDAIAIWAAPALEDPEFAVRCADNKLMTIMMLAMIELNRDLGADVEYLEANTLFGGFTRLTRDLVKHVRERPTEFEDWLRKGETPRVPFTGRPKPAKA